jgi:hypothetical protein
MTYDDLKAIHLTYLNWYCCRMGIKCKKSRYKFMYRSFQIRVLYSVRFILSHICNRFIICNLKTYFLVLLHSEQQELGIKSCFIGSNILQ